VVTSARQIAGSLGLAVLGGIFTAALSSQFHQHNISSALATNPVNIRNLGHATRTAVLACYAHALRSVFLVAGVLLAFAAVLMLPVVGRRQSTAPGER
jgi:hypothetical protein